MSIKYLFVLVMFASLSCFAQNKKEVPVKKESLVAIADGRTDSILVRWSPVKLTTWQIGNQVGYEVERFTILVDGKLPEKRVRKLIGVIKPFTKEKFDEVIAINQRAAIVKSGIYNEDVKLISASADLKSMMQSQQQAEIQMGLCLFVCESDVLIAKAAGLIYVDYDVKPNERYLYRISLVKDSRVKNIAPALVSRGTTEKMRLHSPKISHIQWGNFVASIIWDAKLDNGIYSAYYLERSEDSSHYHRLSELPIISGSENPNNTIYSFQDSFKNNNTRFYYRLAGVSAFGETGPYSEVVSGRGTDQFDNLPVIHTGQADPVKRKVEIRWRFPDAHIKDVKSFKILRASNSNGPYAEISKSILSQSDSIFLDTSPQESNYYKVRADGKEGQSSVSFPYFVSVADVEPPLAPTGITGKVADNGRVTLRWKQNLEKDLFAYRVFRANSKAETFVEVNSDFIKQNLFIDTIDVQTLAKDIFYKIVAVDRNFNNSVYSEIVVLKRPDKVAPAKPVFSAMQMKAGGISLQWVPSVSEDVVRYELKRYEKGSTVGRQVALFAKDKLGLSSYYDTTVEMGKIYYYQLAAFDEAGNFGSSHTGELEFETGLRSKITRFSAKPDYKLRTITLNWSCKEKKVIRYILYRCKKGEPMGIYKTFEDKEMATSLVEKGLAIGYVYQYQIKAVLPNGVKTEISDIVEVQY